MRLASLDLVSRAMVQPGSIRDRNWLAENGIIPTGPRVSSSGLTVDNLREAFLNSALNMSLAI